MQQSVVQLIIILTGMLCDAWQWCHTATINVFQSKSLIMMGCIHLITRVLLCDVGATSNAIDELILYMPAVCAWENNAAVYSLTQNISPWPTASLQT